MLTVELNVSNCMALLLVIALVTVISHLLVIVMAIA